MPGEAFESMWHRLKNGQSWIGAVKNRCKNGDYYWIKAYATPVKQDGNIIELQSVRTQLSDQVKQRAITQYKKLKSGQSHKGSKAPFLSFTIKLQLLLFLSILITSFLLHLLKLDHAMALLVIAIACFISTGWMFKQLSPLNRLFQQARDIIDDPLACYVFTGRSDEIGQLTLALESLQTEKQALVGRMKNDAQRLDESNCDLNQQIQSINKHINQLNNQSEQAVSAIDEVSATIQEVSNNCNFAADLTQKAQVNVSEGKNLVIETSHSVDALSHQIETAAQSMEKLEQNCNAIGYITDVIRSVSEQINLLALNAAIEAARAGEHGRGFAVVADEVRELAQKTQSSAEEITAMITNLQTSTQQTVDTMQAAKTTTHHCVEMGQRTDQALTNSLSAVNEITSISSQIATATEQQRIAVEEINQNIANLAGLTNSLKQNIEGTAAASSNVEILSSGLRRLADHFFKQSVNSKY